MSWLARVRHKHVTPPDRGRAKSAKSLEEALENVAPHESGRATRATSEGGERSVTAGAAERVRSDVWIVAYQRFSVDYDLPDGTYTPAELRQAKLLVKPGPVLRQRVRWPGGRVQPINLHRGDRDEPWLFGS